MPLGFCMSSFSVSFWESPKSMSLMEESSSDFWRRKFSGFKSLWQMLWSWQYLIALRAWRIMTAASLSFKYLRDFMR